MEGKFFRFIHAHRVELVGFGFFLLCLVAGILLLFYFLPTPPSLPFLLPKKYTEQPDPRVMDFYTRELDCRISLNTYKKDKALTLDAWIDTDREQLSALTVLSRDKKNIKNNEKKIVYTVVTAETGMSKIYYEGRGDEIIEIRVFGENEKCYSEFEAAILSF